MIGEYVNTGRGRRVTISPAVPGAQYRITAWALNTGSRSATPAVESITAGKASELHGHPCEHMYTQIKNGLSLIQQHVYSHTLSNLWLTIKRNRDMQRQILISLADACYGYYTVQCSNTVGLVYTSVIGETVSASVNY